MAKRELLFSLTKKDFDVIKYKAGGPGGQHRNKVETAIRITHKESGAIGNSSTHKSQYQNKKEALKRLSESPKFKSWLYRRMMEITNGETIEQKVEKSMNEKNIKIEFKNENGNWIDEK